MGSLEDSLLESPIYTYCSFVKYSNQNTSSLKGNNLIVYLLIDLKLQFIVHRMTFKLLFTLGWLDKNRFLSQTFHLMKDNILDPH